MSNKQSILFLHGWMQDSHTWDSVIDLLKDQFKCYAPDLPGFGKEPRPKETWSPHDYARWVGEYIQKHAIKNLVVVGHSFGGRIAICLSASAADFDFEISDLVLYATPGYRQPISKITTMAQALSRALKKTGIAPHKLPGAASIKSRLESKDSIEAQQLRDIFLRTIEFNLEPSMQQISTPTLLLWGENDTEVPFTIAQAMHQVITHSKIKIMPNATHFAHLENPALFSGIIRQFVSTTDR